MADYADMQKAKRIYNTLLNMLSSKGLRCESDPSNLAVAIGFEGNDFDMMFQISVDPDRSIIHMLSKLPFNVPESTRTDVAVAIVIANYGLANGSFDYNYFDGSIYFRLTSDYCDCSIGEGLFEHMISCAVNTVEEYNDRFYMLAKGGQSLDDFLERESRIK